MNIDNFSKVLPISFGMCIGNTLKSSLHLPPQFLKAYSAAQENVLLHHGPKIVDNATMICCMLLEIQSSFLFNLSLSMSYSWNHCWSYVEVWYDRAKDESHYHCNIEYII